MGQIREGEGEGEGNDFFKVIYDVTSAVFC